MYERLFWVTSALRPVSMLLVGREHASSRHLHSRSTCILRYLPTNEDHKCLHPCRQIPFVGFIRICIHICTRTHAACTKACTIALPASSSASSSHHEVSSDTLCCRSMLPSLGLFWLSRKCAYISMAAYMFTHNYIWLQQERLYIGMMFEMCIHAYVNAYFFSRAFLPSPCRHPSRYPPRAHKQESRCLYRHPENTFADTSRNSVVYFFASKHTCATTPTQHTNLIWCVWCSLSLTPTHSASCTHSCTHTSVVLMLLFFSSSNFVLWMIACRIRQCPAFGTPCARMYVQYVDRVCVGISYLCTDQ